MLKRWWGDCRIDYILQSPVSGSDLAELPLAAQSLVMHSRYWEAKDMISFILHMVSRRVGGGRGDLLLSPELLGGGEHLKQMHCGAHCLVRVSAYLPMMFFSFTHYMHACAYACVYSAYCFFFHALQVLLKNSRLSLSAPQQQKHEITPFLPSRAATDWTRRTTQFRIRVCHSVCDCWAGPW